MTTQDLPADVERFLRDELESYDQLEALLWLRLDRRRSATVEEVAAALGITSDSATEALEHLRRRGLAGSDPASATPRFVYAAPPAEIDATIQTLADLYEERRLDVIKRMTANAIDRVRTAAIRAFSDAFLLQQKKKDDA
jgi:predicted transcriptional regulator